MSKYAYDRDEANAGVSTSHFLKSPYEGDKKLWNKFKDEIITAVQNACGDEGNRFLFTAWPVEEDGEIDVGHEFTILPMPAILDGIQMLNGVAVTNEERRDRREERKAIKEFNDSIRNLEKSCRSILSKRTGIHINTKFNELGGDPIRMWKWMESTYGPENMGPQEKGNAFIDLLGYKMENTDRFSNYIIEVERLMFVSETSEDQMLGLLLSDNFLPERFTEQVKKAKIENFNYRKMKQFMITQDNQQHSLGIKTTNSKISKIKVLKKKEEGLMNETSKDNKDVKCYNCQNNHHTAQQCQLDACGYCEKFHVGHNSLNCPKRINNKSSNFRNKPLSKEGKSDHRENTRNRNDGSKQGKKRSNDNHESEHKKRFKKDKKIKRVKIEESESDSESEYDSSDTDSDDEAAEDEGAYVITKSVRAIKKCSVDSDDNCAIIDTGADESCFKAEIVRKFNRVKTYGVACKPSINLLNASGDHMEIVNRGSRDNIIDKVYGIDNLDYNLISGKRLCEKGLWVILPPSNLDSNIGVIVSDCSGKVQMIGDKDMVTSIEKIGTYDDLIELPTIPILNRSRKINYIYGLDKTYTAYNVIEFVHKSFHLPMEEICWMAESGAIANFAVTSEQLRKHKYQCPCCIKGNMQARKIDKDNFRSRTDDVVRPNSSSDDSTYRQIEHRNIVLGQEVGADFYGPVLNVSMLSLVDKASGFGINKAISYSNRKGSREVVLLDTKKNIPKILKEFFDVYERYGHHVKTFGKPINVMKTDFDTIFRSDAVQALCRENGISQQYSPPFQHSYNGLAESHNKYISNKVATLFACANWVPEAFWPIAWDHAELLNNLRQSKVPGSQKTRYEEFYGTKPDLKSLVMLPWGQPVEFWVPKSQRTSKFSEHSHTGFYLGPSKEIPGSIMIFNPKSKKLVNRDTYRILHAIPSDWKEFPATNFNLGDLTTTDDEVATVTPLSPAQNIDRSTADLSTQLDTQLPSSDALSPVGTTDLTAPATVENGKIKVTEIVDPIDPTSSQDNLSDIYNDTGNQSGTLIGPTSAPAETTAAASHTSPTVDIDESLPNAVMPQVDVPVPKPDDSTIRTRRAPRYLEQYVLPSGRKPQGHITAVSASEGEIRKMTSNHKRKKRILLGHKKIRKTIGRNKRKKGRTTILRCRKRRREMIGPCGKKRSKTRCNS